MITIAQMPRQLRNIGGMTVKTIRQKYGVGSFVKEKLRKLIPNELADIAVKAAPIVAPFNPLVGAAMRGIGRFDQRGSISDALKQAAATGAFGVGIRSIGGAKGIGGFSREGFSSPLIAERSESLSSLFKEGEKVKNIKDVDKGIGVVRSATEKTLGKIPIVRELPQIVQQQILVGGATAAASAVASFFKGEFREQLPDESMEDYLAARKQTVGRQMRTYFDNYFKFDKDYSTMTDDQKDQFVARYNVAKGGRIGFQDGGSFPLEGYGIGTYNIDGTLIQTGYAPGPPGTRGIASYNTPEEAAAMGIFPIRKEDQDLISLSGSGLLNQAAITRSQQAARNEAALNMLNQSMPKTQTTEEKRGLGQIVKEAVEKKQDAPMISGGGLKSRIKPKQVLDPVPTNNPFANFLGADRLPVITQSRSLRENVATNEERRRRNQELLDAAKKRLQKKKGGVMSIPVRKNSAGVKELDMRKSGGFVPIGVKEKADDVPAMLSKNEFVMTADAVRGAGYGSINKGAQRMYDTMKKLESRVG